jgi:hypothetical protein
MSAGLAPPRRGSKPPKRGNGDTKPIDKNKCKYCGKEGHWARECRKRQPDMAANAALLEEEAGDDNEPSLLMVRVVSATLTPEVISRRVAPVHVGGQVFLNEERATVHLGNSDAINNDHDSGVWYLDTGASNHMTGDSAAFSELDRDITGTVKFSDGSVVEIVDHGSIIFAARQERHRVLMDVYYIPRLRSNIISLG